MIILVGSLMGLNFRHRYKKALQRQEKMAHRILVLNALRSINKLLFKEQHQTHLLERSCHYLTEKRGYYNAWAVLLDASGTPCTTAQAGIGHGFSDLAASMKNNKLPNCIQRALSQSALVFTQSPCTDCPACPLSGQYAGRGGITAKLTHGDKVFGAITLSVPITLLADEQEHALILDIAEDIAFGLHTIDLEKERSNAESALKKSERLLISQDKMASLGRVAAGIAHEIRNPLSGINIYLSTLEKIYDKTEDISKVRQILTQLKSASNKIESVIKRVMDFSKRSTPKFKKIDINQPIREALHLTAVMLRKSGIKTETSLEDPLPPCFADPNQIEEVLLNLINNAAEAMHGKITVKKISLTSAHKDEHIEITVSDTGPGIPLNIRSNIFHPFFTTKHEGTGIGLNLCRRIIQDHGGTIDLAHPFKGGTKFVITLPIIKGEAP